MTLVVHTNVLRQQRGSVVALPPRRRRLSTIMRQQGADRLAIPLVFRRGQDWRSASQAEVDRAVRLRHQYAETLVGPHDTVILFRPVRGKNIATIGLALAAIALTAFAGPIGAAIAGPGTWGAFAIKAGIIIGAAALSYAANRARASKKTAQESYGNLSGGGNLPKRGDRKPLVYGRCWTTPPLSQPDYFVYLPKYTIVYKRLTVGVGKFIFHKVRIGEAEFWNETDGIHPTFRTVGAIPGQDTDIEFIYEQASQIMGGDYISSDSVSGQPLPRPSGNPSWTPWFRMTPQGIAASRVLMNWQYPALGYTASSGQVKPVPAGAAGLIWQAQKLDPVTGNPTGAVIILGEQSLAGALSSSPIHQASFFDLPEMAEWQVRARNRADENPGINLQNEVTWDGMTAITPNTRVRQKTTEIAIRVAGVKGLPVSSLSDIQVEATRIVPVWNGTAWVEQPTQKAVWALADLIRGEHGLDQPAGVDVAKFYAYANRPDLAGFDEFNGVLSSTSSFHEAANEILVPLRGEHVKLGAIHSFVRDESAAEAGGRRVITRRQIVRDSGAQNYEYTTSESNYGDVIVEFDRDGDPKKPDEVRQTAFAHTRTPKRYKINGLRRAEHAIMMANWLAARSLYRGDRRSQKVEWDGRLITRGTHVAPDLWYLNGKAVAGVESAAGNTLALDVTPNIAAGATYALIRNRLGREWGVLQATFDGNRSLVLNPGDVAAFSAGTGLSLENVLAKETQDPTTVMLGDLDAMQETYVVDSAVPSDANYTDIEMVRDDPRVWQVLGETIVVPEPPTLDFPQIVERPSVPSVFARCEPAETTIEIVWGIATAKGAVSYDAQLSYDEGTTWEDLQLRRANQSGRAPARQSDDDVRFRARGYGGSGLEGAWQEVSFSTVPPKIDGRRTTVVPGTIPGVSLIPFSVTGVQIASQTIERDNLKAGIIDATKLATTLQGIGVTATVPTVYQGDFVTVGTPGVLYRWNGTAYVKAVDAGQLTGLVTSEQIASVEAAKVAGQLTNAQLKEIDAAKLLGTVKGPQIEQAALDVTKFAASIRPVEIMAGSTLPTTGNTEGRKVYLQGTGRSYTFSSGAWKDDSAAANISGTLTATQIASVNANTIAGTIIASQIGSVNASAVQGQLSDSQIAGLSAAKLTTQIKATNIEDGAITTPKVSAGAIVTASLAAQAVTASKLQIASTNRFYNDNLAQGAKGWTFSNVNLSGTVTTGFSTDWCPAGTISYYISAAGTPPAGQIADLVCAPLLPNGTIRRHAVTAGWRYEFSACLSIHRASAELHVVWFNAAGESLTSNLTASSSAGASNTGRVGGDLRTYPRVGGFVTAPANAVSAELYFRLSTNGNSNPYLFVSCPMFAEATATQTELSPYVVAGATTIDGVSITTNSINAAHLMVDSVTATAIKAGEVTAGKLAAGAVVAGNVAANAIQAGNIAALAVSTDNLQALSITAAKIAVGAVGADQVAARAISAKHLVVSDAQNLILDGTFISGIGEWSRYVNATVAPYSGHGAGAPAKNSMIVTRVAASGECSVSYGVGTSFDGTAETGIACAAGEQFYFELWAYCGTSNPVTLDIVQRDLNGNLTVPATGTANANGWSKFSVSGTATAAGRVHPRIGFGGGAGTGYFVTAIRFNRKNAGLLVVDGSILTNHLAADSVTAAKIKAGEITAGKLAAGAVLADSIAANAVTAGKLAANSVLAANIAAGQITAGKLALADTSNIALNGTFMNAATGQASAEDWDELGVGAVVVANNPGSPGGTFAMYSNTPGTTGIANTSATKRYSAKTGDIFYLASTVFNGRNSGSSLLYLHWYSSNGSYLSSSAVTSATRGAWVNVEGRLTAPAGTASMRIGLAAEVASSGAVYFGNVVLRRGIETLMIVQGAIVTEHMTAGSIHADRLVGNTITAAQISAGAIGANQIAAGAIVADKMGVGISDNLIVNSDFLAPITGWSHGGSAVLTTVATIDKSQYSGTYTPAGMKSLLLQRSGDYSGNYYLFRMCRQAADGSFTADYPVTAGAWYEWSAYLSAHRCRGYLRVYFYNDNGDVLAQPDSTYINNNQAYLSTLTDANRAVGKAQAPSAATRAQVCLLMDVPGTDPHLFMTGVVFGKTNPNITKYSDWAPAAGTIISGSGIAARSIKADKIEVGSLTGNEIQALSITADKLNVNNLAAISANLGSITAGSLSFPAGSPSFLEMWDFS